MGRPRKPVDYDYEIHRSEIQIERFKIALANLQEERTKLIQEKAQKQLEKLHQMLVESGQPIDAFIKMAQAIQDESTKDVAYKNE